MVSRSTVCLKELNSGCKFVQDIRIFTKIEKTFQLLWNRQVLGLWKAVFLKDQSVKFKAGQESAHISKERAASDSPSQNASGVVRGGAFVSASRADDIAGSFCL